MGEQWWVADRGSWEEITEKFLVGGVLTTRSTKPIFFAEATLRFSGASGKFALAGVGHNLLLPWTIDSYCAGGAACCI
jgi:hypothetical protein